MWVAKNSLAKRIEHKNKQMFEKHIDKHEQTFYNHHCKSDTDK